MMRKLLILTLLLTTSVMAFAQEDLSLKGVVQDAETNLVPGAHIKLTKLAGMKKVGLVTDVNGAFNVSGLESGSYLIKISFVGLKDYVKSIKLQDADLDLGILKLENSFTQLDDVVVQEDVVSIKLNGDTTEMNAKAYKVMRDASAEDLVRKMPTVVIVNGKIQAQGEDVQRVLVDGKPFFTDDPSAALKNLPAEVIDRIQIYDQASDQSQFTGFNDGNTTKTMNIITRPDMRNGEFGKLYAGYGTDERYSAGGNLNIFNKDQRISLIGLSNNINIQNFSSDDILGVMGSSGRRGFGGGGGRGRGGGGPGGGGRPGGGRGGGGVSDFMVGAQGGITRSHAAGINFSDQWGEKLEVTGSYFFNNGKNQSETITNRNYIDQGNRDEVYEESDLSASSNTNHRFNGRFTYEIDENNSIIMRPRVSAQLNDGSSQTIGENILDQRIASSTNSNFFSELSTVNFTNNILYRRRLDGFRKTFSANLSTGFNPKSGESRLSSLNQFGRRPPEMLNQESLLDVRAWNAALNLSITRPIGEISMLQLSYQYSYKQEEADQETFDFSEATGAFDQFNSELSNVYSNDYTSHSVTTGFSRWDFGGTMIMTRLNFQQADLINGQTFPREFDLTQSYFNVLPMVMIRKRTNNSNQSNQSPPAGGRPQGGPDGRGGGPGGQRGGGRGGRGDSWMFMYRTNTQMPSVEQLQNVVDNSNPLLLNTGNPNLKQSYSHTVMTRFQKTNVDKGSIFYVMLTGSVQDNYIGTNNLLFETDNPLFDQIDLDPGVQISQPVNLSGYKNLRTFITYGMPLKLIKSNLNFNLTGSYGNTPSMINDQENQAKVGSYGIGAVLSSNISDKVDFTLTSNSSINKSSNSLQQAIDNNYFSQTTGAKLDILFPNQLIWRNDMAHSFYSGLSDGFNDSYILWNMSLGMKVGKDKLGEINLSIYDLLDQNQSITRNINSTYVEDVRSLILRPYVMLNFIYNVRHFGSRQ